MRHHPIPTLPRSHGRLQTLLGLAVGLFVFGAFVHRPRPRARPALARDDLPTRAIPPAPSAAVLLASVVGEEDPGAAIDAPAPSPPPSVG